MEFGNCGAVLAGYGLWLQELEVGSLVVDAFGDAAIGLLLWLTGVATMATDGGDGGQVVDLVDRLESPRRHACRRPGRCPRSASRPRPGQDGRSALQNVRARAVSPTAWVR